MSLGHPPPPPPKAASSAGVSSVAAAVPQSWEDNSEAASEAETYVEAEDESARAAEPSNASSDAPLRRLDAAAANRAVEGHLGVSQSKAAQPVPPPKAGPPAVRQQPLALVPSHDSSSVRWLPLGQNGQLVMCLSCPQNDLLQQAANILDAALASLPGSAADRGSVSEETLDAWAPAMQIVRAQAEWQDESFALKLNFKSTSAMGLGSNVQKRTRTSRLAMAVALVCDYHQIHKRLFQSYPSLEQLATQAWNRKNEAPSAMPAIQGATAAVAGACSNTNPAPTPMPAPAPRPTPPAPAEPLSFRQRAAAAGVPDDCLQDPFLELCKNGSGWEQGFCAACRKWIDSWHITTPKHKQYLLDVPGTLSWRGYSVAQFESMRASPPAQAKAAPPARVAAAANVAGSTPGTASWSGSDAWSPSGGSGRPPPSPQLPAAPSQPAAPPKPPELGEVLVPPSKEEMCRFFMQFADRLGVPTRMINVDDDDLQEEDDPSTSGEIIDV